VSDLRSRDWPRVSLGDVIHQVKDKVEDPWNSGITHYLPGGGISADTLTINSWRPVNDGVMGPAFHMRFRPGHTLYKSRVPHGVGVADRVGICANTTYVLKPIDSERLLPTLLPYLLATDDFRSFEDRNNKGSTNLFLNFSDIARYEFPMPPLADQQRIAEVLQAAEANCASLASASTVGERSYKAVCKRFFVQERDKLATISVGDVADVQNGTTPRRNREDYWGVDVPWLPTGKVNERRIRGADEFITQKALDECSLRVISAGSTLVAMVGQGATRGRAALLEIDATINQNFAAITPRKELLPRFLFYQLDALYEALRHWSHGSNQKALNCGLVREFRIWAPSKQRQREIVECLDQISKAQEALADRKLLATAVKAGLLGKCLEETR
jgi:type I restriction enzyme, S subunit